MPASSDPEPLDALAPAARRAAPRVRVAVGAAVVLFIAAVAVAAVLSFAASGGGAQGTIVAAAVGAGTAGGERDTAVAGDAPADIASAPILVHVLGAVARPGLVELSQGARVIDAVAAAGGFTAEADPAAVNLARPVVDGEQLAVLAVGQAPPQVPGSGGGGATGPRPTARCT